MKRLLFFLVAVAMAVSCYDDAALIERMDDYEQRLTELETVCERLNGNITSLQAVIEAVQDEDCVTGYTPVYEGSVVIGYEIKFRKSEAIIVYKAMKGDKGDKGDTPVIGVRQDAGVYYWTVDGQWITDDKGNKIKAAGGTMPKLMVEGGVWYASYDNGSTWEKIGISTSQVNDSIFADVVVNDGYVTFTLADGTVFRLPKVEDGVRDYYQDEIAKTKASVNELITEPCLVFPMITDIHYNVAPECPDLLDITIENMLALSKDIRFDFFACLGDITDGKLPQAETEQLVKHLYDQFLRIEAPFYPCIGNHDDNRYKSAFSHSQLHRIYMRNTLDVMFDRSSMCGTNYYKDFYGLGIRCVFLNANDGGEYGFSDETCAWLEEVVKTDFDIYAFSHISPVKAHQYNQTAHKNDARITAALKGAPTFKMLFNGHSHFDSEFIAPFNTDDPTSKSYNPFLAYSLCCNKFQNGSPDSKWPSQAVRPERKVGTVSEDCFDIVVIRPRSGKVNTVRFGAGMDKEFDVNTGESLGESSSLMLPEKMEMTVDFSKEWPFAQACVATADQDAGREEYTIPYEYKYNGVDKTRNLTFTLGSTNWSADRVYSYESIPDRSEKGLYFHDTHGGIILPGIPGMYLSSVSLMHYDKNSKGVRYAIQEGCEGVGDEGNRKLSAYVASGKECVFNMPVTDASPASLESEAGKPYVIQVRDKGGYISRIKVVYTRTKPTGEPVVEEKLFNEVPTRTTASNVNLNDFLLGGLKTNSANVSSDVIYLDETSLKSKFLKYSSTDSDILLDVYYGNEVDGIALTTAGFNSDSYAVPTHDTSQSYYINGAPKGPIIMVENYKYMGLVFRSKSGKALTADGVKAAVSLSALSVTPADITASFGTVVQYQIVKEGLGETRTNRSSFNTSVNIPAKNPIYVTLPRTKAYQWSTRDGGAANNLENNNYWFAPGCAFKPKGAYMMMSFSISGKGYDNTGTSSYNDITATELETAKVGGSLVVYEITDADSVTSVLASGYSR